MWGKRLFWFLTSMAAMWMMLAAPAGAAVAGTPAIDVSTLKCADLIGTAEYTDLQAKFDELKANYVVSNQLTPEEADQIKLERTDDTGGPLALFCGGQANDFPFPWTGGELVIYSMGDANVVATWPSFKEMVKTPNFADLTTQHLETIDGVDMLAMPMEGLPTSYWTIYKGVSYDSDKPEWVASAVAAINGSSEDTAATPSTLSSLRSLLGVQLTAGRVGVVGGGSVVLAALVALPTLLLQRVVRRRYSQTVAKATRWTSRLGAGWRRASDAVAMLPRWVSVVVGIVVTAFLTGLLSPTFGWNPQSARVVLSMALSVSVETLMLFGVLAWIIRRRGGRSRIELRLGSVLVVAGSVLFSRLTGFQPGIVFGLVFALVLVTTSAKATEVGNDIREIVGAIILGLLAWLGYSLMASLGASGEEFWTVLARETLSAITLGTLSALPVALFPFGNVPGSVIREHRPKTWVTLFFVSLILFFVVVLPFPNSIQTVDWPFATWVTFFVVYAVVAVLVWAVDEIIYRRRNPRATA